MKKDSSIQRKIENKIYEKKQTIQRKKWRENKQYFGRKDG